MELLLPIRQEDAHVGRVMTETLDVEELSDDHFRLIYSPGLVEGLAAGDEIQLDPRSSTGFRLVRRGGNVCVWFVFEKLGQNKGEYAQVAQRAIEGIGGRLDGGGRLSLVFTIPASVGIEKIESTLMTIREQIPGSVWDFGNVVDPITREPLRWWEGE